MHCSKELELDPIWRKGSFWLKKVWKLCDWFKSAWDEEPHLAFGQVLKVLRDKHGHLSSMIIDSVCSANNDIYKASKINILKSEEEFVSIKQ